MQEFLQRKRAEVGQQRPDAGSTGTPEVSVASHGRCELPISLSSQRHYTTAISSSLFVCRDSSQPSHYSCPYGFVWNSSQPSDYYCPHENCSQPSHYSCPYGFVWNSSQPSDYYYCPHENCSQPSHYSCPYGFDWNSSRPFPYSCLYGSNWKSSQPSHYFCPGFIWNSSHWPQYLWVCDVRNERWHTWCYVYKRWAYRLDSSMEEWSYQEVVIICSCSHLLFVTHTFSVWGNLYAKAHFLSISYYFYV